MDLNQWWIINKREKIAMSLFALAVIVFWLLRTFFFNKGNLTKMWVEILGLIFSVLIWSFIFLFVYRFFNSIYGLIFKRKKEQ